jgi:hypothetical protein
MKQRLRAVLAWTAAAVALAAVFAAYLSPHVVVDLATRVWSCF